MAGQLEPPANLWVTAPGPQLECSCCLDVFKDPVTLHCGHSYCRMCAVRWFTVPGKLCPAGRCVESANCKPAALPAAFALRDVVDSLRVHCRHGLYHNGAGWAIIPYGLGCSAQLRRADVAAHDAVCVYAMVECPFAGCSVKMRRCDTQAHDAQYGVVHAAGERSARHALQAKMREAHAGQVELKRKLLAERDAALLQLEALKAELIVERAQHEELEAKTSNELNERIASEERMRSERNAARGLLGAALKRERAVLAALGAKPHGNDAQPPASKKQRMTATGASADAEAPRLRPSTRGGAGAGTTHSGRKLGPA